MSILRPDYLPRMRGALSNFCDETRSFHADHGDDPVPGSPAVREQVGSQRPELLVTAWCMALQLIESASDHAAAFVKTITPPIQPIACWTCARSMLETCSLASWLLDPHVSAHTRVKRGFAIRYKEIEQYLKYVRTIDGRDEDLQRIKKRIVDVERDACELGYPPVTNKMRKRIGIGQVMPTVTTVIKCILDEEGMYRLSSAVIHGQSWATRTLGSRRVPEGDSKPTIGGVPVARFQKDVDIDKLAPLGLTVAKAFAKPVWDNCNYVGWDKERLIVVLDSTYDKLGLKSSERFWRPPKD